MKSFDFEGNLNKAREFQGIYHQMAQFVTNPTYEYLNNAKQIRAMLERATVNILYSL